MNAAAAQPSGERIIDPLLAQRRAGDDQSLADDLFVMLLENLQEEAAALENPACPHHRDALLERVHRLHGAVRCCGTPGLESATGQLEQGIRDNASDRHLQCLIAGLLTEIRRVQQAAASSQPARREPG